MHLVVKLEIMQHIAPLGNVYQAGTLSGNPIAMIAGFTLLNHLKNNPSVYNELDEKGNYLRKGLFNVFDEANIPVAYKPNRFNDFCFLYR